MNKNERELDTTALPGFTAELSLNATMSNYLQNMVSVSYAKIFPQIRVCNNRAMDTCVNQCIASKCLNSGDLWCSFECYNQCALFYCHDIPL